MDIKGKVALVTGGTGGLGSVIVKRFLEKGLRVVATISREKELPPSGASGPTFVKADITNEDDVRSLFKAVRDLYGTPDIVVNTVGGFLPQRKLQDVSLTDWEGMMSINMRSAFLCTREAIRAMEGKEYGRIVHFSAMVGLQPAAGKAPYAISKAGVSMLVDIAARELRGTQTTINAIAPSIITTEANKKSMPGEDVRKWVTPESIADLILWLCSEEGGVVSGTTLKTYGGL